MMSRCAKCGEQLDEQGRHLVRRFKFFDFVPEILCVCGFRGMHYCRLEFGYNLRGPDAKKNEIRQMFGSEVERLTCPVDMEKLIATTVSATEQKAVWR